MGSIELPNSEIEYQYVKYYGPQINYYIQQNSACNYLW